jgi:hypothetical protein
MADTRIATATMKAFVFKEIGEVASLRGVFLIVHRPLFMAGWSTSWCAPTSVIYCDD